MTTTAEESQKLSQDDRVELLIFDATGIGGSTYYFSTANQNPSDLVTLASISYSARSFTIKGLGRTMSGPQARPKLTIDNVDRFWWDKIEDFDDLKGAKITYRKMYRQHLDDGSDPDTSEYITLEEYEVHQRRVITPTRIEFVLKNPFDVEESKIGREMLRDSCWRTYRVPTSTTDTFVDNASDPDKITCPYTGSTYLKRDGTAAADWSEDACGQKHSDCEARFPNQTLPIQAFKAVGAPRA